MKFIGITCSMDDKKYFLNIDYIQKIVAFGFLPLIITPNMVTFKEKIINSLSALVISGGGDINPKFYGEKNIACKNIVPDERVRRELELLEAFLPTKKPLLGICYGMQLMNIFFGGSLIQDINTEINHVVGYHEIEVFKDFPLIKGKGIVNTSHHQAVKSLANGLEVFCKADDGIVEGFYLKEHPFCVGVQWHPERDKGEFSFLLWQNFLKKVQ